ncbi:hypothetical protein [Methanobrevibacter oralis]|uniref:Uncharacterized protein n=1 Tax=Methanobrevibacter oralis TaxID=66851 RepID=A0A166AUD8_METOA|nr:hypothetical protein [Methanobrevibacter oralis]KZX12484.1 hypothetical protein MBORA_12390 [Methanobrevibacter oralis]
MNKKILFILMILGICLLLTSPVFAKEKVKIKIDTAEHVFSYKGYITIELTNSKGKEINSKGTIHYNITDEFGNYNWAYEPYDGKIVLRLPAGKYKVNVKFDGDSHYRKAKLTKEVTVKSDGSLDAYTYYDNHNYGLNQKIDDYIEDNYWDDEIYDDPFTYDGEGP